MDAPTPSPRDAAGRPQEPMSQADRLRMLAELNQQMVELNARLAYLQLILKLGVR